MKKLFIIAALLTAISGAAFSQIPLRNNTVNQIANGDTLQFRIYPTLTNIHSTNALQVDNVIRFLDSVKVGAAGDSSFISSISDFGGKAMTFWKGSLFTGNEYAYMYIKPTSVGISATSDNESTNYSQLTISSSGGTFSSPSQFTITQGNFVNNGNTTLGNGNDTLRLNLSGGSSTITGYVDLPSTKLTNIRVDSVSTLADPTNIVNADTVRTGGTLRLIAGSSVASMTAAGLTTFPGGVVGGKFTASTTASSAGAGSFTNASNIGYGLEVNAQANSANSINTTYPTAYFYAQKSTTTSSGFGGLITYYGRQTNTLSTVFSYDMWRLRNAGASFWTQRIICTNNAGTIDTALVMDKNGIYFTQNKLWQVTTADTANTSAGLSRKMYSATVNDGAHIQLPSGISGWGEVFVFNSGTFVERARFYFNSSAAVTLIDNSTNVGTTAGVDNKLNIYDNGTRVALENQLGGNYTMKYVIWY